MKILVTATNYSQYCRNGKLSLEKGGYEIIENPYNRPMTEAELIPLVRDVDGVITGAENWGRTLLETAGKLKVIARFGVGVDNIDLEAAREQGIMVTNCPGLNSNSVAEHTVALLLCMLRQIPQLNQDIRRGRWKRMMYRELKELKVGMMGFGRIAQNTAGKLKAFGCFMMACDKAADRMAAGKSGVVIVPQDQVLRESDIILIHLPAAPDTWHLINDAAVGKMKRGVILINTARGSVVDEMAVKRGLDSGKIGGFASDVFEHEPVTGSEELFNCPGYVATPHVAAESYENYDRTSMTTARAVMDVLEGREPENRIV